MIGRLYLTGVINNPRARTKEEGRRKKRKEVRGERGGKYTLTTRIR
jgi:hypothetical protein